MCEISILPSLWPALPHWVMITVPPHRHIHQGSPVHARCDGIMMCRYIDTRYNSAPQKPTRGRPCIKTQFTSLALIHQHRSAVAASSQPREVATNTPTTSHTLQPTGKPPLFSMITLASGY